MLCPRCNGPLSERIVGEDAAGGDVKAALCEACSGVWLEARSLPSVCPTLSHLSGRKMEVALTGARGTGIANCPGCGQAPYELRVLEVAVDFCTACGGVWLDADEYGENERAEPQKKTARDAYRAPPTPAAPTTACAYCGGTLDPGRNFMRERGHACARCHYALEQRLAALRAEPSALDKLLQAVLELAPDLTEPTDSWP